MSYSGVETSVAQGAPVELYEFIQGLDIWAYSSSVDEYTHLGRTYRPGAITRDRIKQGPDAAKNDLKLTFPRDNPFASQFLGFAPDEVTTVTIYRGHAGDGEFIAYWKGRVIGASISGNAITVDCESVFTSIRRPGLRARYEYTCRHALYSVGCGASAAAYEVPGSVGSISTDGALITIPAASGFPDGYFTGGILAFGSQRRFITHHADVSITISRPIPDMPGGASINLYPGCNHDMATCQNKFDNIDNYGGFPWIPIRNPFDGSSAF